METFRYAVAGRVIIDIQPERRLFSVPVSLGDGKICFVHLLRFFVLPRFFAIRLRKQLRKHVERVQRSGQLPPHLLREGRDFMHVYFFFPSLLLIVPDEPLPVLHHGCHFEILLYTPTGATSPQPSTVAPGRTTDLIFTR